MCLDFYYCFGLTNYKFLTVDLCSRSNAIGMLIDTVSHENGADNFKASSVMDAIFQML